MAKTTDDTHNAEVARWACQTGDRTAVDHVQSSRPKHSTVQSSQGVGCKCTTYLTLCGRCADIDAKLCSGPLQAQIWRSKCINGRCLVVLDAHEVAGCKHTDKELLTLRAGRYLNEKCTIDRKEAGGWSCSSLELYEVRR